MEPYGERMEPYGDREARVLRNERYFRSLNLILTQLEGRQTPIRIVCECGKAECMARIEVDTLLYASVRQAPRLFLIMPGHAIPDYEQVVQHGETYEVVEKFSHA